MTDYTTLALRVTAISSVVCLVIVSAGFGAVFACRMGIQHNQLLAILMVVMALALEGIKPIAIAAAFGAIRSWHIVRGFILALLGLVAVAYSLTSELSLMAMTRGDLAAQRQHTIDAGERTKSRIELAKQELARVRPARPSQEVREEVQGIEALPGIEIKGKPCGGIYDGKVTKEHCPRLVALRAELARAERREELQSLINDPKASIGGPSVTVAGPGSHALATYLTALGVHVSTDTVAQWLSLVPVLALELGSAFSVVVALSVGHITDKHSGSHNAVVQKVRNHQHTAGDTSQNEEPSFDHRCCTKRNATEAKLLLYLQGADGVWKGSERELAVALGTSKPTARRAIQSLANQNAIEVDPSKSGTTLSLL